MLELAFGFFLWVGTPVIQEQASPSLASDRGLVRLPDGFRAIDLTGRTWTREDLAGRVVLIEFWASWCGPCLKDVPSLRDLYRRYHDQGFEILGISLDTAGRVELERWIRRLGINWPQIADFRGYEGVLAQRFGVVSLPASFLFDRDGRLQGRNLGEEARRALLLQLLSPKSASGSMRR